MSGQTDDQSLRLDEAFREVSAQREQRDHVNGTEPGGLGEHGPEESSPFDDVIRRLVKSEVAAALADSGLMLELEVLTAAVDHLRERVDAIVGELDVQGPMPASTRGPRIHALRAMSNGRLARGR